MVEEQRRRGGEARDGRQPQHQDLDRKCREQGQRCQPPDPPLEPRRRNLERPWRASWSWQPLGSVAVGSAVAAWFALVAVQVSECGFYSDDWMVYGLWTFHGYSGAVQ